jgi:clostripain
MLVAQRERRALAAVLALACFFMASSSQAQTRPTAEWTVMVFMNGDNNLEEFAISDYLEMMEVGSSNDVQIIVQFDRWTKRFLQDVSGWDETLRFRVEKEKNPEPENAIPRSGPKELDMGDGAVLQEFVEWAMKEFPARKYALVIWDHGDGFRNFTGEDATVRERYFRSTDEATFRTVSHDDTNHNLLYTREVQDSLTAALKGRRLDVLGFDACLMGMVEVAYALRDVADVLVASEELVPANGWKYDHWLGELQKNPAAYGAEELSGLLVQSYKKTYESPPPPGHDEGTTQSAIRLKKIEALAEATSKLSKVLEFSLDDNLDAVRKARESVANYGNLQTCDGRVCYYNVDLGRFLQRLSEESTDPAVTAAAHSVQKALRETIVDNWASPARKGVWGSSGLAIYFPPGRAAYEADGTRKEGYEKCNMIYPVQFVQHHLWANLLHALFQKVP